MSSKHNSARTTLLLRMYRTLIIFIFAMGVRSSPTPSFVTQYARQAGDLNRQGNHQVITPQIYEMNFYSTVSNRYATTVITSKVKNDVQSAQEATFSVILPESAFITGFTMEIGGKNYTAYIKEKEEAKKIYNTAVSEGKGAAIVAASARDSNRFTVSVNVEPQTKAVFYLFYEELLKRKDFYEFIITTDPNQHIRNMNFQVFIKESVPLSSLETTLRSANKLQKNLDPVASISKLDSKSALVQATLTENDQKRYAKLFGTDEKLGLSGQFVVQYDVNRDSSGGELLVKDGYFVHFFAPNIEPLSKHIIFVSDTSRSMSGGVKMKQLKRAIITLFDELMVGDLFHLLEFGTNIYVLNIDEPDEVLKLSQPECGATCEEINLTKVDFPNAYGVNSNTLSKATKTVDSLWANGGSNIYEALRVAIRLAKDQKAKLNGNKMQPIIMFLSTGKPSIGTTDHNDIISKLSKMNEHIPIYSLVCGDKGDREFLQRLSLRNYGFALNISEEVDTTWQVQKFYKDILSTILSDVTFKYPYDARDLTRTSFPTYSKGRELVVSGKIGHNFDKNRLPEVSGRTGAGDIQLEPKVFTPTGDIERLWAYLTVQQLLGERQIANNKTEIEKKALDIALKYSFVTPFKPLVVVKPDQICEAATTGAADQGRSKRIFNFPGHPFVRFNYSLEVFAP